MTKYYENKRRLIATAKQNQSNPISLTILSEKFCSHGAKPRTRNGNASLSQYPLDKGLTEAINACFWLQKDLLKKNSW
jgi:hypothetical protein